MTNINGHQMDECVWPRSHQDCLSLFLGHGGFAVRVLELDVSWARDCWGPTTPLDIVAAQPFESVAATVRYFAMAPWDRW